MEVYALCLSNISKDCAISNLKKTGLKESVKLFSVDFSPFDTNNILHIYKYLIKRTYYKTMFRLIKAILIGLLTGIVNVSNHTKSVLLSNQKCMIQPTLINLHSNEYNQEFHYYQFAAKLDRCVRCCNNLNDLSNKLFVPNKIENLNLSVFNMIIGINKKKQQSIHLANVNVDLKEENVIQLMVEKR